MLFMYMFDRWKIIINSVPENLASVNIIQWAVQLRYSLSNVCYVMLITLLSCVFCRYFLVEIKFSNVHQLLYPWGVRRHKNASGGVVM